MLTSVSGDTILYDSIGNPIKIGVYDEATDTWGNHYTLTWDGRRLVSIQNHASAALDAYSVTYAYNDSGTRTQKVVDGVVIDYILDGNQMLGEKHDDGTLILYIYDENGLPAGMTIRQGSIIDYFLFERNLQGDIIALYNEENERIATYTYDAWGNFEVSLSSTSTMWEDTVSQWYNPFRYRGYYWDFETGNYYLQTRYYNPDWGRFISADGIVGTGYELLKYNIFAYCNNNPILWMDSSGNSAIAILALIVCAAIPAFTLTSCDPPDNTGKKVKYDVPLYAQGNTNLCWAYSQIMVESYQKGEVLTQDEADARAKEIAIAVHGIENWNQAGKPTNRGALRFIHNIDSLYRIVETNGPVYAHYGNFSGKGHLVVVTGVDLENNLVYVNNPWNISRAYTWDEFRHLSDMDYWYIYTVKEN